MKNNLHQTRDVVNYFSEQIRGVVLDLGAGSAKYKDIIKMNAVKYTAFDMFPGERIDVVGDILKLPFDDNSFDTIVSTQVLEHVEKPWIMIDQIYRVLKKDGVCLVSCPFLVPYHPDPGDYFRYTKAGLISLFKNTGFEIIECEYYGKFFTVFEELIRFLFFSRFKAYKNKKQSFWSKRFLRYFQKLSFFLDGMLKKEQIVYANVYIIAKKQ